MALTDRSSRLGCRRFRVFYGIVVALILSAQLIRGQNTLSSPPPQSSALTNIYQIWSFSPEEKSHPHFLNTEFVIYYFDPEWNNAWGECRGTPTWLPLGDCPFPLRPGQRIALNGVIDPLQEKILWNQSQVRVLEEDVSVPAAPLPNLHADPTQHRARLVQVDALVDQRWDQATHIKLNVVTEGRSATVYLLKGRENSPIPGEAGDFVRLRGVYSPQFDRDGHLSQVELWVARPSDIQVVGNLKADARFDVPVLPIEEILEHTPTNSLFHVDGVVRYSQPGGWVVLWDATGQVMVRTSQTQPLRLGDRIEAVGYPRLLGIQQCLQGALYRRSSSTNLVVLPGDSATNRSLLRLAEQVRNLTREQASRRLPVRLQAVVTWSHHDSPFAYVQDASGGIRLINPRWRSEEASKPGTIVRVEGEVAEGDYVPVITNAVVTRRGWWSLGEAKLVSLEEALTGVEDGSWVQMRGYVRSVTRINGLQRLEIGTSGGDFVALVPFREAPPPLQGAVVRVLGVCTTMTNPRHQLTGVQMLVYQPEHIHVEAPQPEDFFATPLRPLSSLRRFSLGNALGQRVRVSGTVVLHQAGRYLYLQEGSDSLFALSQQPEPLRPGDLVEAVGFPGYQGRRFVLREAVYRRLKPGVEPKPIHLPEGPALDRELEGLLVQTEGVLLNRVDKQGQTRLLIQNGDCAFEAGLEAPLWAAPALDPGSRISLTGVHQLQTDEYGRPRSFHLQLRSWRDIVVLRGAPWWTPGRTLAVVISIIGLSALALFWGMWTLRKNRLLHQAQTALQASHSTLEARVTERTRALQEEVAAKERAVARLAEAQERLILASRQAGMAEVATGVLHNVGNVLNSVNVSSTLIRDSLRGSRVASLERVAQLLREHAEDLASFLASDPKGKLVPKFIAELAERLRKEHSVLEHEAALVGRNVEHIKEIVAMQQSYGRVSGMLESVSLVELLDQAVEMGSLGFSLRGIQVEKLYGASPRVTLDRHRFIQIILNLLSNAKHALEESGTPAPKVRIEVRLGEPECVLISVADNGIGISPDNLTRIFAHGFTTKKNGHGFGLHSGALAAQEMGGKLTVHSDGPGHGAVFTLQLPLADSASSPAAGPKTTMPLAARGALAA